LFKNAQLQVCCYSIGTQTIHRFRPGGDAPKFDETLWGY
jgi:hypothetical protein